MCGKYSTLILMKRMTYLQGVTVLRRVDNNRERCSTKWKRGRLIQDTTNVLVMLKNENCTDWSYIHARRALTQTLRRLVARGTCERYPLAVKRAISNCFSASCSTFSVSRIGCRSLVFRGFRASELRTTVVRLAGGP